MSEQTKNSEINLLHCPFCNNEGILREYISRPFELGCLTKKCPGFINAHIGWLNKEEAIKAWNTRTIQKRECSCEVQPCILHVPNVPPSALASLSENVQERSGLRVEFPEKQTRHSEHEGNYNFGWNACIDEMKKLNSLTSPQGLKPLSEEEIHTQWFKDHSDMTPSAAYVIKYITSKFAVPNEGLNEEEIAFIIYKVGMRNLASEEEIKSSFTLHYTTWDPTVNEAWVKAKAILSALENKREKGK